MKLTATRTRILRRLLSTLSIVLVLGLAASWFVGAALIAPSPRAVGSPPSDLNAIAISLNSESGCIISGWYTKPEVSDGVVVLVHGIRSSRLSMLQRARMLHRSGYATVMIDLQSHGESTGEAITMGYLEQHDVCAAVEFARRKHPDESIGLIGVSLGGAAALFASPLGIDALIIESVYPNIRDAIYNRVTAKLGPIAPIPASLLAIQFEPRLGLSPESLRPIDHVAKIDCPVLIASGTADKHTTEAETKAIFAAALEPKHLWLVDGAAHVDLMQFSPREYQDQVATFLDRYLRN